MSKSRYCEVDPPPNARLLPYSDPLNGMFWAETGENPYDNKYDSPEWAHRCVKPWELTAHEVEQLEPKFGNLLYCSGPACKRGPNGCNAMGCHGIREAFCSAIGDVWIWVSDIAAERDGGRAQCAVRGTIARMILKKMTPTIQELVEPWFKIMTALDNAWDSWRDLGVGIEAPFPDAAWQLSGAYTKSVEMLLNHIWGIDGAWLNWFFWDKPNGRGIAIVGGVEWNIVTLDDLIEMLNAIANPGGGIEANGGSVDA